MTDQKGRNGLFIVFEGIDGSGKSTMVTEVARAFHEAGRGVWVTREPTDSEIGQLARAFLKEKDADYTRALLMAADRQEHTKDIEAALKDPNTVVLCDRYKHSALAYQALAISAEDINVLNKGNLDPDYVIYFDVLPEVAYNRVRNRGAAEDVFEKVDILRKVRQNYLDMDIKNMIKINANLPLAEVKEELFYKLKKEKLL